MSTVGEYRNVGEAVQLELGGWEMHGLRRVGHGCYSDLRRLSAGVPECSATC